MAIGTTPCSLNDDTLVQFIYARALSLNSMVVIATSPRAIRHLKKRAIFANVLHKLH
jgi:hypothetical protein